MKGEIICLNKKCLSSIKTPLCEEIMHFDKQENLGRVLTEFVLVSCWRILFSISTVEEHFSSPAARQSTATHWAIEKRACLERPPDCGDGLELESKESNKMSKLVFPDCTKETKNLCSAYRSEAFLIRNL